MAKKTQTAEYIDTSEALLAKMEAMRKAQKIFAAYTQEQATQ